MRFIPVGVLVVAATLATTAGDRLSPICPLAIAEERTERDDLALALELARSELDAAREIHGLLQGLWENEAVERMLYLAGKHDFDLARHDRERHAFLLQRQEAVLEQYERLCDTSTDAGQRERAVGQAHRRHIEADCGVRASEVAIAEVDLEFRRELLESVLDLRRNSVATRQDVIVAERDVEMATKQLAQARQRIVACRTEGTSTDR